MTHVMWVGIAVRARVGDTYCYGCPISNVELSSDSLGKHHRSHIGVLGLGLKFISRTNQLV
jgi:hypothetical protein